MKLNHLSTLYKIQEDVPIVKYATGLVGIAVSISGITYLVGDTQAAVRIFGMTFVGMMVLIVLSVMERTLEAAHRPAKLLMWVVVGAFAVFILMTVSVFAFEWPCAWMRFLGVASHSSCETGSTSNAGDGFVDPSTVVPKNVSPAFRGGGN